MKARLIVHQTYDLVVTVTGYGGIGRLHIKRHNRNKW